jgi:5-methylcytosine-specific restriction endonuclease McrA
VCSSDLPARAKAYYEANREKIMAQTKAYREADRDKYAAYRKARYEANREKVAARNKAYREANREKIAAQNKARRFRKTAIINHLLVRQRGRCAVCHTDAIEKHHLDHVIPLALGGTNNRGNFQLLCPTCNLSKSRIDPVLFMQRRGKLL